MPSPLPTLSYGGDYNPEQWPLEVQVEDVRLMQAAGVNLATVAVFSWAKLEPEAGRYEFDWLDEVLDRLHSGGVRVDLATATASPPPWLTRQHPEILPVTADGTTLWQGGRQSYCPSSPVFAEHALRLVRAMAERYAGHPALALWHVSNELGCHNALCYCDVSAEAFRRWLQQRYGDVEALNHAWGTAFWSQRYGSFDEVLPPRSAPTFPNPTQQLDFHRFSSDQLLANFIAERDILHELSPGVPVTTNFMVMEHTRNMDYLAWGPELDIVSNDHYMMSADPAPHRELAFSADLTRGAAGGRPVLDDGRLTDGQGRTVDFRNTLLILTSNLGSSYLVDPTLDPEKKHESVMAVVRQSFKPEFLNRLDEIVVFDALTKDELAHIVDLQLALLEKRLAVRRITIAVSDEARTWLADKGYDPAYGARPLRRLIQTAIGDPLAKLLIAGEVADGGKVSVRVADGGEALALNSAS